MREFFDLLKRGELRAIFITPTKNGFLEFFRYLFVGGIATVIDWIFSFASERLLTSIASAIHPQWIYIMATTIGFTFGIAANFLLSRAFVFAEKKARAKTKVGEFFGHLIVGVIGLFMSYAIIWAGTSFLVEGGYMRFRILATVIVFFWNYLSRKFLVYQR